jgi:hypothetical protein
MYAITKGRDAVAPDPGIFRHCRGATPPHRLPLGRRLPW